jgi:hypothetical protein
MPLLRQQLGLVLYFYRAFSHDVTAAVLVFQNNETAAMLAFQTNPVGVQLFSYVNTFFCSEKFVWLLAT